MPSARWDIFCKVVDNYGDVGVAWRLARQLAAEHNLAVTLWCDDIGALARIAPGVDARVDAQSAAGITVRRWEERFADRPAPGDVVIEAFGCGLPEPYVEAMTRRLPPPHWFVLEYLSAECWVEGTHGLASPHPRLPLARRFWFPGLTAATGGLLRERGLLAARDACRRDAAALRALWARLRVPPPDPGETRISMFCYPYAPLASLCDAWADGDAPVACLVPEGVATGALDRWAGGRLPHVGEALMRGRLTVRAIPFVGQDEYDRLLWACDVNFVRGEDSFVRAQWAARPFVWHIYAQDEAAHRAKLDAFLARYLIGLDARTAVTVRRFWHAWNGDPDAGGLGAAWVAFAQAGPDLGVHGERWAEALAAMPDLADGLVKNARNGL